MKISDLPSNTSKGGILRAQIIDNYQNLAPCQDIYICRQVACKEFCHLCKDKFDCYLSKCDGRCLACDTYLLENIPYCRVNIKSPPLVSEETGLRLFIVGCLFMILVSSALSIIQAVT